MEQSARPRALVVDDSWYMQLTMADVLESEGYEVSVASDGLSAIDTYQTDRPDVVLLDLVLPDAKQLRQVERKATIRRVERMGDWTSVALEFVKVIEV